MNEVFAWVGEHWAGIALFLSLFIEIAPVKVKPVSALLNWLGKRINASIIPRLDAMQTRIVKLEEKQEEFSTAIDENEKDRIRHEFFTFSNSIRRGDLHSQDEFKHMFAIVDKYNELLARTDDSNGVFTAEYEYVKEEYKHCLQSNLFLN